ncbi:MAG: S8 family serine peptidase, partial [Bacilli bacterium]
DNDLALYSNRSNNIYFSAPGGDYEFIDGYLDLSKMMYTTFPTNIDNQLTAIGIPQGYMFSAGTSLAAPCISAVLANYYSRAIFMTGFKPSISDMKSAVTEDSEDLGEIGRDNLYGYGLPDIMATISKIKDTLPPTGSILYQVVEVNEAIDAHNIIQEVYDNSNSKIKINYNLIPDFSKLGEQSIEIKLEDESGNSSLIQGVILIKDTIAPSGIFKEFDVYVNEIIYPDLFIEDIIDNYDSSLVKIETDSDLSTKIPGVKYLEIKLTDISGNTSIIAGNIKIIPRLYSFDNDFNNYIITTINNGENSGVISDVEYNNKFNESKYKKRSGLKDKTSEPTKFYINKFLVSITLTLIISSLFVYKYKQGRDKNV